MATTTSTKEATQEFPPFFKVHKDGHIERYHVVDYVPPAHDPKTGVETKDVVISPESGLSARLFIPKINHPDEKFPLLIHYHGGGFCIGSPFDTISNNLLNSLVSHANVIALSVDYRLAPEHPLPIAYDDSWAALQWVATHSNGQGPDPVLNRHADFGRVFLAGESAGANIAHYVAVQAGVNGLGGMKLDGVIIVHPFFGSEEVDEMYKVMCPTSSGCDDDPKLNPGVDPNLSKMGCSRVLVCLAEKDGLRNRGLRYYETLGKSRWGGKLELFESEGEDHGFNLFNPTCEKALALTKRMVSFMYQD